jgi:positive regulator of sigma E activity
LAQECCEQIQDLLLKSVKLVFLAPMVALMVAPMVAPGIFLKSFDLL